MKREVGTALPVAALPKGYSLVAFQPGDEEAWAEIEASVLEFATKKDALDYFSKNYLPYADELKRRTLFIESDNGEKIATFTAWWNYTGLRRYPFVHWVAVKPPFQGRGLGKAIISAGVGHMIDLEGDCVMYIPTSTWSHKAIKLYRWAGFDFERSEPAPGGFENQTERALKLIKDRV